MHATHPSVLPAKGKLAVLTPGMGAVATTLYAGVNATKKGLAKPIGSHTQMGAVKPTAEASGRTEIKVKDLVPLADLTDLVFGGWDIFPENAFDAACHARVIEGSLLQQLEEELSAIQPMPAVFDKNFVRRLEGSHVKSGKTKMDLAQQLREDICEFISRKGCDRAVMVWCASTEVHTTPTAAHMSLAAFEKGLRANDPAISPSQIYAYAALKEGVPYANGSPNVSVETPAIRELSALTGTPLAGSDFKTGQTLLKTVLAPGLRNRQLGVRGWYSTNILGNRDGEVLDDPGSFRSKEVSKSGVLNHIFSKDLYPDLYGDLSHTVRIDYYPPRGDNKEGWDNIDIFGWMGYPMQIKVNFLCRDSILAAPVVLDLALYMDLAARAEMKGIQEWLSFYFKAPLTGQNHCPEHDFFAQTRMLEEALRTLADRANWRRPGRTYIAQDKREPHTALPLFQ
ncbi:MAG: inositol-3-phosphate synthase [Bdellovibrionales bacterium]